MLCEVRFNHATLFQEKITTTLINGKWKWKSNMQIGLLAILFDEHKHLFYLSLWLDGEWESSSTILIESVHEMHSNVQSAWRELHRIWYNIQRKHHFF